MNKYNIPINPKWVLHGGSGEQYGYESIVKLHKENNLPDLVFTVTYPVALGVYRAARELKLNIPNDIDVICFGNANVQNFLSPSLSCVDQPTDLLASKSMEIMLDNLSSRDGAKNIQAEISTELIIRGTCSSFHKSLQNPSNIFLYSFTIVWFIMRIVKCLVILLSVFFLYECSNEEPLVGESEGSSQLHKILQRINPPSFPEVEFNVKEYGAIPDDNKDDRTAFIEAINKCNSNGGGVVFVPAGEYICNGPIVLKSNVNFNTEEGSFIRFSNNPVDDLPVVFTRWEGVELYNYSPLIYAFEQENIAVTGLGVFDGQAKIMKVGGAERKK